MRINTRTMVTLAMLGALAYLTMLFFRIPVMSVPPNLKFDPKDVVLVIGGFILGPLHALVIIVVVALVEMVTVSDTGLIGFAMNVIASAAFVCPAVMVYKWKHNLAGAVAGLALGCVSMTVVMLLWNYILTPLYMPYVTREQVTAMLIPIFLPFNLIKSILNAAITMLLYKPAVTALRKAGLYSDTAASVQGGRFNLGVTLVSVVLVLAMALLFWILWR